MKKKSLINSNNNTLLLIKLQLEKTIYKPEGVKVLKPSHDREYIACMHPSTGSTKFLNIRFNNPATLTLKVLKHFKNTHQQIIIAIND